MVMRKCKQCAMVLAAVAVSGARSAEPTIVSLQGRLSDGGGLVNGPSTLRLSLFDDAHPLIGAKVDLDGDGTTQGTDEDVVVRTVTVTDGLFETDFGPIDPSAFDGTPRFLQIEVDGVVLSRIPFRSTPGVAEAMTSPDGSTLLALTADSGGIVLGGTTPAARLDIRPTTTQVAGEIASAVSDISSGTTLITRTAGFVPGSVLAGDVLLARSPDGQTNDYLGMAISVDDGAGTITTDFDISQGAIDGWSIEVRQPIVRIDANQNPSIYADGQPRSGVIVTDDGRVGVNRLPSGNGADVGIGVGGLDVTGPISTSSLSVAGTIDTGSLTGAFIEEFPSAVENETAGALRLGPTVIQWGRWRNVAGQNAIVQLGQAVHPTYQVSISQSGTRRSTAVDILNGSQFQVTSWRSFENSGPVVDGSGGWIAIGRAQ